MTLVHIQGNTWLNTDLVAKVTIEKKESGGFGSIISRAFSPAGIELGEFTSEYVTQFRPAVPLDRLQAKYLHEEIRRAINEKRDVIPWNARKPTVYFFQGDQLDRGLLISKIKATGGDYAVRKLEPLDGQQFVADLKEVAAYGCLAFDLALAEKWESESLHTGLRILEERALALGKFLLVMADNAADLDHVQANANLRTPVKWLGANDFPRLAFNTKEDGTRLEAA
ncbi:hypothetical protein [Bordetella sp. FB-8]|uniref:hypothetical protein n=1 Tax=Bordetella sp. FB-8 TaxID=1159870 RepID=UPI00037A3949|nr:hypothetical protein [Bordetella sp. FB-8]